MSADNREVALVKLQTPRTAWTVESVEDFTGSGEQTTHACSVFGVFPLTWWQQPLISDADKKLVLGLSGIKSKPKLFDSVIGQPLFWNERKPMCYWKEVLNRFKIQKVFNLSPGCGMLERVCIEKKIPCIAVCKNETHAGWITHVLERAACTALVNKGTGVYDQEIKASVDRLYSDVILRQIARGNDEQEMLVPDELSETPTVSP